MTSSDDLLTVYSLDAGVMGGPSSFVGVCKAINFVTLNGSQVRFSVTNVKNQDVYLERWSEAAPDTSTEALMNNAIVFINALVHMLGGSVTLTSEELKAATARPVDLVHQADPWKLILKQKDGVV